MQGTHNSQNIFEKEWSWQGHTSWFQNLLQNYNNQDSAVKHKDRHIDQWGVINSLEINTYINSQLILTWMLRLFNGKNSFFQK